MRRVSKLWITLALVYASLIAWHQPLRGPLTEGEVRAALGDQYTHVENSGDAQVQAFHDFFLNDDGRPFYMVNLNALPEQTPDVKASARAYGTFMLGQLVSRASYPVLSADIMVGLANSLGGDLGTVDQVVVVRYRSRRDFLEIVTSSEFQQKVGSKGASLEGWYSAPSTIGPIFSLPAAALVLLLVVGLIGAPRGLHQTRRERLRQSFDPARKS